MLGNQQSTVSDTKVLLLKLGVCQNDRAIADTLSSIRGPFAFVYWRSDTKQLWFGRDILGRRSLCWKRKSNDTLQICSLADSACDDSGDNWVEVPADGFFCFDVDSEHLSQPYLRYRWKTTISGSVLETRFEQEEEEWLDTPIASALNKQLPCDSEGQAERARQLETKESSQTVIKEFIAILNEAVRKRALSQNFICRNCVGRSREICTHPNVAVLFSGGIDSTVLALLLNNHLDMHTSIDLLNVAFEQNAPDRLTGLKAVEELRRLTPDRKWNFVEIDVTKDELIEWRSKVIKKLVFPLETVIDDSIGCSIWFAARGKGLLERNLYETPARVLIHGLGADEQLAGYSRHRRIFDTDGWMGLLSEIGLELDRISFRNLGRDDRIISDHGREARFPFLDEDVVSYLNGLRIDQKCNLKEKRGIGEKMLLRVAARTLGLVETSCNEKRAIQFGTRIAKLENRKEKGDMKCQRLT